MSDGRSLVLGGIGYQLLGGGRLGAAAEHARTMSCSGRAADMQRSLAGCACVSSERTAAVVLGGACDESPVAITFLKGVEGYDLVDKEWVGAPQMAQPRQWAMASSWFRGPSERWYYSIRKGESPFHYGPTTTPGSSAVAGAGGGGELSVPPLPSKSLPHCLTARRPCSRR